MSAGLARAARGVLLAGFAGPDVPAWLGTAYREGLGGICLYGNNVARGRELADLSRELRALAPTAVLALDEEGGDVTRLHTATGSPSVGPAALGRYDDTSATRAVAAGVGAELAAAGVWLDLAPCADVNSDPRNPVIGVRSFGADPDLVARHTAAFVEGLADAGVAASVKHFPGHGDTRTDSHHALPTVPAAREVLEARELVPFRAAVAAGAATVMTSHVVLPAIDADHPATTSPAVLRGVLREDLRFEGVVVTDALDMAGATADHDDGIGGAAVRALAAGADLLCLGPQPDDEEGPRTLEETVAAILSAVREGRLRTGRLLDAVARVERLRARWTGTGGADADAAAEGATEETAAQLAARGHEVSRTVARALADGAPVLPGALAVQVDTVSSPAVGTTAWGLPWPDSVRVAPDALPSPESLPDDRPVLLVVRRATSDPRVRSWVRETLARREQAWLVELGWPDPELDALPRVLRTWGASAASTTALAHALAGPR